MQDSYDYNHLVDTIQVGTVNSVFTARPLNGEALDKIDIDYNGVVGWKMSRGFLSFDYLTLMYLVRARITEDYFDKIVSNLESGLLPFHAHQICLSDSTIVDYLKDNKISNYRPGIINEQIHVSNIKLNTLHAGSTIQIGNNVKLEVVSGRTLCATFFQHLQFENIDHAKQLIQTTTYGKQIRPHPPIGVMCRVIKTGEVKLNDIVIADPTTSLHYKKLPCINRNLMIGPNLEYDHLSMIRWLSKEEVKSLYGDDPEFLEATLEHFENYKIPKKEECTFFNKGTIKDKHYPVSQHIDKQELNRRLKNAN